MRKIWFIALGIVVLAAAGLAWAGGSRPGGAVNRQAFTVVDGPLTTTTDRWANVPGLKVSTSCHDSPAASATVGLELGRGSDPLKVRVVPDDPSLICLDCPGPEDLMRPRAVTLDTGGVRDSRSFTFVDERAAGSHGTRFQVQWKLVDPGGSASVKSATLNVLWDPLEGACY